MPPDICPLCKKKDPNVQCEVCEVWYHQKCALPAGLKQQQIEELHWHCTECSNAGLVRVKAFNESVVKYNAEKLEFNRKERLLSEDLAKCEALKSELEKKIIAASDAISSLSTDLSKIETTINETKKEIVEKVEEVGIQTSQTYADALKKKARSVEKNLVIVESADDIGINQKKNVVANALKRNTSYRHKIFG